MSSLLERGQRAYLEVEQEKEKKIYLSVLEPHGESPQKLK